MNTQQCKKITEPQQWENVDKKITYWSITLCNHLWKDDGMGAFRRILLSICILDYESTSYLDLPVVMWSPCDILISDLFPKGLGAGQSLG